MSNYNKKDEMMAVDYLTLRTKYRSHYAAAIRKLTNPNRFGPDHYLRPEYVLDKEERNALLIYVPELLEFEDLLDDERIRTK